MTTQSDSRFSFTKHLSLLVAGLAAVATLSFSNSSHAFESDLALSDTELQGLIDIEDKASLDDIYADFSKTIDARHVPGHGPGGGRGPGYGPGYGPGHGPGYGPGYGPGHDWRPRVQCRAVNGRGVVFYGVGRNVPDAQNDVLSRCYRVSRRCNMQGCNRI